MKERVLAWLKKAQKTRHLAPDTQAESIAHGGYVAGPHSKRKGIDYLSVKWARSFLC